MRMKQLLVAVLCVLSFFGNGQSWEKVSDNQSLRLDNFYYDTVEKQCYAIAGEGVYKSKDFIRWDLLRPFNEVDYSGCGFNCHVFFDYKSKLFFTYRKGENYKASNIHIKRGFEVVKEYDSTLYYYLDEDITDGIQFNDSSIINSFDKNEYDSEVFFGDEFIYSRLSPKESIGGYAVLNLCFELSSKVVIDTVTYTTGYSFEFPLKRLFYHTRGSYEVRDSIEVGYYDEVLKRKIVIKGRDSVYAMVNKGGYNYSSYAALGSERGFGFQKNNYVFSVKNNKVELNDVLLDCTEDIEYSVGDSMYIVYSVKNKRHFLIKNNLRILMEINGDYSNVNLDEDFRKVKNGIVTIVGDQFVGGMWVDVGSMNHNFINECGFEYESVVTDSSSQYVVLKKGDSLFFFDTELRSDVRAIPIKFNNMERYDAVLFDDELNVFSLKSDGVLISEKYNLKTKTFSVNEFKVSEKKGDVYSIVTIKKNNAIYVRFREYWVVFGGANYNFSFYKIDEENIEHLNDKRVSGWKESLYSEFDIRGDSLFSYYYYGDIKKVNSMSIISGVKSWNFYESKDELVISKVIFKGETFFVYGNNKHNNNQLYKIDIDSNQSVIYLPFYGRLYKVFNFRNELYISTSQGLYKYNPTIDGTFSFQKVEEKNYVYPNPSSGKLSLDKSKLKGVSEYSLYDLAGNKVEQGNIDSDELNLSVESGMYILNLVGEEKVYSQKIIIE